MEPARSIRVPSELPKHVNISAQNEILRDIRNKLDATIYVSDARVILQNGVIRLNEPLFQRTPIGYVASWVKSGIAPVAQGVTVYEDAIIDMINQHKSIYHRNATKTMLSNLSDQERTFAEQNKLLINQIIDIAKRIFRGHDHEPRVPAYETREPYSALQKLKGWTEGNSRDSNVNPLDEVVNFLKKF